MTASLVGVDAKLERAVTHINNLQRHITAFTQLHPYSVRVQEDVQDGQRVGRLIAIENTSVPAPDIALVLLAGEALYQLRSALDHLIHQLVILAGNAAKLTGSRRHQFPIFETAQRYRQRAGGMTDGVSQPVADLIEREQPYKRTAHAPNTDALWILQDLNNTDKHRLIPVTAVGIGEVRGRDTGGAVFSLTSRDVVLKDGKMFWTFTTPSQRYDDIDAEITCAVAFQQAMHFGTFTVSMHTMLFQIASRANQIIGLFRPLFFSHGKGTPSP